MSSDSSTSSSVYISPMIVKPLAAGGYAFLLDKFLLKNQSTTQSMYFGLSTAVGTGLVTTVFSGLDLGFIPDTQLYSGKTISQRLLEIAGAGGAAYITNKFVLKNDFKPSDLSMRVGAIVLAEIAAEYTSDYLTMSPLSYLV